jgi:hypothetical protein
MPSKPTKPSRFNGLIMPSKPTKPSSYSGANKMAIERQIFELSGARHLSNIDW